MKVPVPLAIVAALALTATATGCTYTTGADTPQTHKVAAHIAEVKKGMTTAQVRAILGKPDVSVADASGSGFAVEDWVYTATDRAWQLSFSNGRLDSKDWDRLTINASE